MPAKKKPSPAPKKITKIVEPEQKKPKGIDFSIVGLGASAGGLETLKTFFSAMPPDSGMAFVIIQHLSPSHKSIMASLMEKQTSMAVAQIEDGTRVRPNHVYLNPPGMDVAIFNGRLHLLEPVKTSAVNMPVDFFFRSLAQDQGGKAIAVILSGTASDGTLGIKAVKGEGGMAMVQEPDTAKYDGMPRSAIETGLVDFILPVEKMPETLIQYVQHPLLDPPGRIKPGHALDKNHMYKVFALIRSATGHDFSHYKPTTIARRVERRLAIHQIKTMGDYVLFLQKNPAEVEVLFKNLVIGVTGFFRDPEAFKVLGQEVLPGLVEKRKDQPVIRLWVAGCSTGEEAYSIAMIMSELLEKTHYANVQIFATDIDPAAIDFARRGVYPENIGADISPERLDRFFTKSGDGFQVKKQIRDMVVFSLQNLVKDPPFSRLDLVSCRNLLIYMDAVLQKKIIPLFHYTLNPDGILFLGTSESVGNHTDLFEPVNSKQKIFKRKSLFMARRTDYPDQFTCDVRQKTGSGREDQLPEVKDLQALVERVILDTYAPAGVLINDTYDILHFIGETDQYLVPPRGKPSFNLKNMARPEIRHHLITAIHRSIQGKEDTICRGVKFGGNGVPHRVDISVKPMGGKDNLSGFRLVMFEAKVPGAPGAGKKAGTVKAGKEDGDMESLRRELQSTREYLQSTIEELETSNEELKSTNEELQSVNEELQSTNEELETSKEELQSTNEELATVNEELQNKVDDYSKAGDEMNNLLAATEIAVLFVDTGLCIKNCTPAASSLIKLIPTDIGRPLDDLKTCFEYVDLVGLAGKVLRTLNTVEQDILSRDGVWYALKIIPYRTIENVIDGVVITFLNVDTVRQADKFKRLATVLADSNDAVTVLDMEGNILAWNRGAQKMYGWTESEALKMNLRQLLPGTKLENSPGDEPGDTPGEKSGAKPDELKEIIEQLEKGEPVTSFKTKRRVKSGETIDVWLTITALKDDRGRPVEIASTERDLAWLKG
jgi:two-component system CheB/CheR fusion protein